MQLRRQSLNGKDTLALDLLIGGIVNNLMKMNINVFILNLELINLGKLINENFN